MGNFEQQCLLALLRCGPKSSAVDVYEVLTERTGKLIKFGAVYTTLDRMSAKGWLSVDILVDTNNRRKRRLFTLTGVGGHSLSDSMSATARLAEGLDVHGEILGNAK